MDSHGMLGTILIFLATAVVIVPVTQRLGLGSVIGYLLGGVLIGPFVFGFIGNVQDILHFSEFGVVLLLFIIGLELEPKKLWSLRMPIFGMGSVQVIGTTLLFFCLGLALGFDWRLSLLAGMGFSLSSTALALQVLKERNLMNTTSGQSSFSILLFQDIAVIPMVAGLSLLAVTHAEAESGKFWKTVAVLLLVVGVGRFALRPVLRWIASLHLREIFTAFALLLVFAMSALMQRLELSMGLGAFIAGVLLADSEYKHALETDIEPFKGLLLGLFFMSVGMSIDLKIVSEQPLAVFLLLVSIVTVKILVLLGIGRTFGLPRSQIMMSSVALSQAGEFAFVLFGAALGLGIISLVQSAVLSAAVALSMVVTPFLVILEGALENRRPKSKLKEDVIENDGHPVIIAGFGRFGQIVGRLLYANRLKATVLDYEPDQIELLRRFGFKIYYGDATRLDLLEAAGAKDAKILVAAIDDTEECLKLVDLVQTHFPHLKIYSRARNVQHVYQLMNRQIAGFERETFESSLSLGTQVLTGLGWDPYTARRAANTFRRHNYQMIDKLHPKQNDQKDLIAVAKQARVDLEKMFDSERKILDSKGEGWH